MDPEGRSGLKGSSWMEGTEEAHSLPVIDCAAHTPQLVLGGHVHTACGPDASTLPFLDRALPVLL